MKRIYEWTTRRRYLLMALFLAAAILCSWCRQFIAVNYDMNDYLPVDSSSTVSLEKMNTEFDQPIPNVRVMIRDVSKGEALKAKEALSAIPGVLSVTWIDDVVPFNLPFEMISEKKRDAYYKDQNALFVLTVDEEQQLETIPLIYDLIGTENAMSGSAVSTVTATSRTVSEIRRIVVITVLFLLFVLLLTTSSWAEPFIILLGLAVAIVLNMGSNLMFGEISFVTNAAGNILQLAVSLDYAVFLLHRFEECRKEAPPGEAMVQALTLSTSSILSSGLTTVIGFLALVMMRFRIGPDLGLALAKGIAISLLTVFFFMPGLILTSYPLMDRTRHSSLLPSFRPFGRFIQRVTVPLAVVFAVLIVPSYYASTHNSYYYGPSHLFGTNTRLGRDTAAIEEVFGKSDNYVLMVPNDALKEESALAEELEQIDAVQSVLSLPGLTGLTIPVEMLPETYLNQLRSEHFDRIVVSVSADYEGAETFALVEQIRTIAQAHFPGSWYLAGQGVSTYDLMSTVTADITKVNLLAVAAIFLVLLVTMRSVMLPVILVLTIETAIWVNLSIPFLTGHPLFFIAYLIISSVQLGATVDYAILLAERYKENRIVNHLRPKDSIAATISDVSVFILTSATVLAVVGFLLGWISTHGLLSQLGMLLGKGTFCSLTAVLFVLPGLLMLFDRLFVREELTVPG